MQAPQPIHESLDAAPGDFARTPGAPAISTRGGWVRAPRARRLAVLVEGIFCAREPPVMGEHELAEWFDRPPHVGIIRRHGLLAANAPEHGIPPCLSQRVGPLASASALVHERGVHDLPAQQSALDLAKRFPKNPFWIFWICHKREFCLDPSNIEPFRSSCTRKGSYPVKTFRG